MVRSIVTLWHSNKSGLGASWLWDEVVFWFGFGQGVNKSGEEALVTHKPTDNISGSRDLSAKPKTPVIHIHIFKVAVLAYVPLAVWQLHFQRLNY